MMSGAIEFYDACIELGVQPVIGLELPLAVQDTLSRLIPANILLLATNLSGWANLCKLSSLVNTGLSAVDFKHLAQYQAGLICLEGGYRSALKYFLRAYDCSISIQIPCKIETAIRIIRAAIKILAGVAMY